MASIPTLSLNLRASINRNLNEIVELHEELLGDVHRVVPHSEYTQPMPSQHCLGHQTVTTDGEALTQFLNTRVVLGFRRFPE